MSYDYGKHFGEITLTQDLTTLPEERTWRLAAPEREPERHQIVLYLGCNVLRTSHMVRTVTAIFDRLGLDYVAVGGPTYCCGIVHHRQGGNAGRRGPPPAGSGARPALRRSRAGAAVRPPLHDGRAGAARPGRLGRADPRRDRPGPRGRRRDPRDDLPRLPAAYLRLRGRAPDRHRALPLRLRARPRDRVRGSVQEIPSLAGPGARAGRVDAVPEREPRRSGARAAARREDVRPVHRGAGRGKRGGILGGNGARLLAKPSWRSVSSPSSSGVRGPTRPRPSTIRWPR